VPTEPLRGKIVIDTYSHFPQRHEQIIEQATSRRSTPSCRTTDLTSKRVITALNNIECYAS
jgi:predicted dinucleotide-binding enzyme